MPVREDYDAWLKNRYGEKLYYNLVAYANDLAKDCHHDFVDNVRFAAVDDREALLRYEVQRQRGCCGYFDDYTTVMMTDAKGGCRQFRIGYNWGH